MDNYCSLDSEGILRCKIDDLCKSVLSARTSLDMIQTFEESVRSLIQSVGRLIRGYPDIEKHGYFEHNVRYLKDVGYFC